MKKLNYIMVLALMLVLGACAKLIEEPVGVLTPEGFFNKPADGQTAIMGAYALFESYEDYGNDIQMSVGARDDQEKIAYAGDHMNMDLILPVTASNQKSNTQWYRIYGEIGAANTAIAGIQSIPDANITTAARNALIAEATVIRAFDYFRLVRLFGAIPYIDKAITDPASVATATKMPTADIYTHIIADLEASKDLLPNSYDAGATPIRSRVSRGTAYTVLADVYLTRQNWTLAAQNAEYVINHKADFGYDLLTDFAKVFDFYGGNDNIEYIWSVDFSHTDHGYPIGRDQFCMLCGLPSWYGWAWGGWGTVYASAQSLRDFQSGDYRRKITFWEDAPDQAGVWHHYNESTKPFPQSSPAVAKTYRTFVGHPSVNGLFGQDNAFETDANWPIYRYAEVLLIAAEAENDLGNTPVALTYANLVRARARNFDGVVGSSLVPADFAGLSQAAFQDSVILERKIELAFEYKRWFDITRLNLTLSDVFGPSGTDPLPNSGSITQAYRLWPIPQVELDKNPNLSLSVP
jgi:starch-binding outer membrane protein, SusD/RagB family